ncbi:MAG: DNA topoisomerase I [Thaumarchaeota archaeon]|nr:DNA topoisomerase I [Nitrososphaerota archaeon]
MIDERIAVIAEKPDAARKIAQALGASNKFETKNRWTFEVFNAYDGKHYLIFSAAGHLYDLSDPQTNRGIYPLYDVGWFHKGFGSRNYGAKRGSGFQGRARQRIDNISKMSVGIRNFVNACDLDIEGETIGFNVLEYSCSGKGKSSLRAKFSTLTEAEIRQAFSSLTPFDPSQAKAGQMRHFADYLWGINLSRVLTSAANSGKEIRSFINLTMGRVQGPTLSFVVDREIQRMVHVPMPRWDVKCRLEKGGVQFEAKFKDNPIKTESKARVVYESTVAFKSGKVKFVDKSTLKFPPRYLFNLSELQRESHRLFYFSPSVTLALAEKLYLQGLISYPRTDSQKLPEKIGPEAVLKKLALLPNIGNLIAELHSDPKRRRYPWQGPLNDPAHPAIFPTGEHPLRFLSDPERKVFELIVRRFCNAFASDAILEKTRFVFDLASNEFVAEGAQILDLGWVKYYPYFPGFANSLQISLSTGDELEVKNVELEMKFNAPPVRFSEASLLLKMEDENLGTKATRAETISTLIKRFYIKKMKNELLPEKRGLFLVETLRIHSPEILSTGLTRELERKLDSLQSRSGTDRDVAEQIMKALSESLRKLRKIEIDYGIDRAPSSERSTYKRSIGHCPKCKLGELELIRSRTTGKRFIRCSNFDSGCRTSSPAPKGGMIRTTGRSCTSCGWPRIVLIFSRSTSGKESCGNYFCPSRRTSVMS